MSGLLSREMLADLVINIANIVILFLLTKALVYKPVKKYLSARKEKIAEDAARTAELQQSAQSTRTQYEALLAEADAERTRLLSAAEKEAQTRAEEIVEAANVRAEQTVAEAQARAQEEKQKAVTEAKDEIASLALSLSEKIMGRAANDADAYRVAQAFFEGLDV